MLLSHVVWENVYGFNMKSIQRVALQEPLVDLVEARQVTTGPCLVKVSDYIGSYHGYRVDDHRRWICTQLKRKTCHLVHHIN